MAAPLFYDTGDAETIIRWEELLDVEIKVKDPLLDDEYGLAGETDTLILLKDDLNTNKGGQIRTQFAYQLEGRGRVGGEQLVNHEEGFATATDNVYIDVLRNAFKIDGPMSHQRVSFDGMELGRRLLADWAASKLSFGIHLHAAGISLVTDSAYTLNNAISAMNSTYVIRPNGKAAGALTSGDIFDYDVLLQVIQFVKTVRPKLRPAKTPVGDRFCIFLHPDQVRSLKETSSSMFNIWQNAMQGGALNGNPIFTHAIGDVQGCLLFESDLVPPGLNSGATAFKDNTRRAWVGGAGAISLAFGRGHADDIEHTPSRWTWTPQQRDYGYEKAIAVSSIVGAKRNRYTKPGEASAREAGVVVIETFADRGQLTAAEAYQLWTNAAPTVSVEA